MARQEGVNVEKLQGGLGRLANGTDNHVAIIVGGMPAGAVATAIANAGKGVVLTSVYEAEQLGINASFDANNSLTIYNDIVEFFRLAPEATLYVYNSIVDADIKTFINQNKEIKGYAFGFTYSKVTPNLVTTITAQQLIVNALAAENRFIDFVILGANELDVFTQDLHELEAPNVSVCIACETNSKKVALGSILGMKGVRKVNENIGSVDIQRKPRAKRGTVDYPLTDALLGRWLNAYTTAGVTVDSLAKETLTSIIAKGFIVAAGYEGYAGFFFENSYTCTDLTSDFAFIENNSTWNKAARIIRSVLLPRVKGVVKKDPNTGFIATTTAASWQASVEKGLTVMVADDEISAFTVAIDPKQVVNSTSPVVVQVSVVADGIVHEFNVKLGLTNSI